MILFVICIILLYQILSEGKNLTFSESLKETEISAWSTIADICMMVLVSGVESTDRADVIMGRTVDSLIAGGVMGSLIRALTMANL